MLRSVYDKPGIQLKHLIQSQTNKYHSEYIYLITDNWKWQEQCLEITHMHRKQQSQYWTPFKCLQISPQVLVELKAVAVIFQVCYITDFLFLLQHLQVSISAIWQQDLHVTRLCNRITPWTMPSIQNKFICACRHTKESVLFSQKRS